MPMTTFMGVDAKGNGQVLGYAFLMNESAETLTKALEIFLEESDGCTGLQTVVLDTRLLRSAQ